MTDGIGRLSGYGYGIGNGYMPQRKNDLPQNEGENKGVPAQEQAQTPVDPNRVMAYLANNAYVGPRKLEKPVTLDEDTVLSVQASMADFQRFYEAAAAEVGPELALAVTDAYLDRQ